VPALMVMSARGTSAFESYMNCSGPTAAVNRAGRARVLICQVELRGLRIRQMRRVCVGL
jgi:hypothetical protein